MPEIGRKYVDLTDDDGTPRRVYVDEQPPEVVDALIRNAKGRGGYVGEGGGGLDSQSWQSKRDTLAAGIGDKLRGAFSADPPQALAAPSNTAAVDEELPAPHPAAITKRMVAPRPPRARVDVGMADPSTPMPDLDTPVAEAAPKSPADMVAEYATRTVRGDQPTPVKPQDAQGDALEWAKREAGKRGLISQLGRGFSEAADLMGGTRTDKSTFDTLDAKAGEPVREQERKQAAALALADKMYGRKKDAAAEARANKELELKGDELKRHETSDIAAAEDRDLNRKRLELEAAANRGDRKAARDLQYLLASMARTDKLELKHGQTLDRETQALEKRIPSEAAGMVQKMGRLRGEIPEKGDIPGVGPLDRLAPDWLPEVLGGPGDAGRNVRQDVSGVVSTLLQMQSGKAVSEKEVARKLVELGLGPGAPDSQFRRGLDNLQSEMRATLKQKSSGFSPEAVEAYKGHGGITESAVPEPPAHGLRKQVNKRTGQVRYVDANGRVVQH